MLGATLECIKCDCDAFGEEYTSLEGRNGDLFVGSARSAGGTDHSGFFGEHHVLFTIVDSVDVGLVMVMCCDGMTLDEFFPR